MRPETLIKRAGKLERKRALANLLTAIEQMPSNEKAALLSRVMKEVVAGRISSAEAHGITKAVKT